MGESGLQDEMGWSSPMYPVRGRRYETEGGVDNKLGRLVGIDEELYKSSWALVPAFEPEDENTALLPTMRHSNGRQRTWQQPRRVGGGYDIDTWWNDDGANDRWRAELIEMYESLPKLDKEYQPDDVKLLEHILQVAEFRASGVTANVSFGSLMRTYEEIMRERGLNPVDDTFYYRFLLKLAIRTQDGDWWEKFNVEAAEASLWRRTQEYANMKLLAEHWLQWRYTSHHNSLEEAEKSKMRMEDVTARLRKRVMGQRFYQWVEHHAAYVKEELNRFSKERGEHRVDVKRKRKKEKKKKKECPHTFWRGKITTRYFRRWRFRNERLGYRAYVLWSERALCSHFKAWVTVSVHRNRSIGIISRRRLRRQLSGCLKGWIKYLDVVRSEQELYNIAAAFWMNKYGRRFFCSWKMTTRIQRDACDQVRMKSLNAVMRHRLQCWLLYCKLEKKHRKALTLARLRRRARALSLAFMSWAANVQYSQTVRDKIALCVMKSLDRIEVRAFERWVRWYQCRISLECKAQVLIGKLVFSRQSAAMAGWLQFVAKRIIKRHAMQECILQSLTRLKRRCLGAWHVWGRNHRRLMSLEAMCKSRMAILRLASLSSFWKSWSRRRSRNREIVITSVTRIIEAHKRASFVFWKGLAKTFSAFKKVQRAIKKRISLEYYYRWQIKYLQHRKARSAALSIICNRILRCLTGWREVTILRRTYRDLTTTIVARRLEALLSRSFAQWELYIVQAKDVRAKSATALRHVYHYSTKSHFQQWVDYTCERMHANILRLDADNFHRQWRLRRSLGVLEEAVAYSRERRRMVARAEEFWATTMRRVTFSKWCANAEYQRSERRGMHQASQFHNGRVGSRALYCWKLFLLIQLQERKKLHIATCQWTRWKKHLVLGKFRECITHLEGHIAQARLYFRQSRGKFKRLLLRRWRQVTVELARKAGLKERARTHVANRILMKALRKWLKHVRLQQRLLQLSIRVHRTLRRIYLRAALPSWKAYMIRQQSKRDASRRALCRWRCHKLARATYGWTVHIASIKRRRSMIETSLSRLRHSLKTRSMWAWRRFRDSRDNKRTMHQNALLHRRHRLLDIAIYFWRYYVEKSFTLEACRIQSVERVKALKTKKFFSRWTAAYKFVLEEREKTDRAAELWRYTILSKVLEKFEGNIVLQRRNRMSRRHYHEMLAFRVLAGWICAADESKEERLQEGAALSHFQFTRLEVVLSAWKEFVLRKRRSRLAMHTAMSACRFHYLFTFYTTWIERAHFERNLRRGIAFWRHECIRKCFVSWCTYLLDRRDKLFKRTIALRHWHAGTLGPSFLEWNRRASVQAILRNKCSKFLSLLLRRHVCACLRQWHTFVMWKVASRSKAVSISRVVSKRKVGIHFEKWLSYCAQAILRRCQKGKADDHFCFFRKALLLKNWRQYMMMKRDVYRQARSMATRVRLRQLRCAFSSLVDGLWEQKGTKRATSFWMSVVYSKSLTEWQVYCTRKSIKRRHSRVSRSFWQAKKAGHALASWKEYITGRRKTKGRTASALSVWSNNLKHKCLQSWLRAAGFRQYYRSLLAIATARLCSDRKRKAFLSLRGNVHLVQLRRKAITMFRLSTNYKTLFRWRAWNDYKKVKELKGTKAFHHWRGRLLKVCLHEWLQRVQVKRHARRKMKGADKHFCRVRLWLVLSRWFLHKERNRYIRPLLKRILSVRKNEAMKYFYLEWVRFKHRQKLKTGKVRQAVGHWKYIKRTMAFVGWALQAKRKIRLRRIQTKISARLILSMTSASMTAWIKYIKICRVKMQKYNLACSHCTARIYDMGFTSWLLFSAEEPKLRRAFHLWRERRLLWTLSQFRLYATASMKKRFLLGLALKHWVRYKKLLCFIVWRAYAESRWQKALKRRDALFLLRVKSLSRTFTMWYFDHLRRKRIRSLVDHAMQYWCNRTYRAAFTQWTESVLWAAKKAICLRLRYNLLTSYALISWKIEWSGSRSRLQRANAMRVALFRRIATHTTAASFTFWRGYARNIREANRLHLRRLVKIAKHVLDRWRSATHLLKSERREVASFDLRILSCATFSHSKPRRRLRRILMPWLHHLEAKAFRTWMENSYESRRDRLRCSNAILAYQKRLRMAAFGALHSNRSMSQLLRQFIAKQDFKLATISFTNWKRNAEEERLEQRCSLWHQRRLARRAFNRLSIHKRRTQQLTHFICARGLRLSLKLIEFWSKFAKEEHALRMALLQATYFHQVTVRKKAMILWRRWSRTKVANREHFIYCLGFMAASRLRSILVRWSLSAKYHTFLASAGNKIRTALASRTRLLYFRSWHGALRRLQYRRHALQERRCLRLLKKPFTSWHFLYRESKYYSEADATAMRHRRAVVTACVIEEWQRRSKRKARVRSIVNRHLGKFKLRRVLKAFNRWDDLVLRIRNSRMMALRLLKRRMQKSQSATFSHWRRYARGKVEEEDNLRAAFAEYQQRFLRSIFCIWVWIVDVLEHGREVAEERLAKLKYGTQSAFFTRWTKSVDDMRRRRSLAKEAGARLMNDIRRKAFRGWVAKVAQRARGESMTRMALHYWRHRVIRIAFIQWTTFASRKIYFRDLAMHAHALFRRRTLAVNLRAWRSTADGLRRLRLATESLLSKWTFRTLTQTLSMWKSRSRRWAVARDRNVRAASHFIESVQRKTFQYWLSASHGKRTTLKALLSLRNLIIVRAWNAWLDDHLMRRMIRAVLFRNRSLATSSFFTWTKYAMRCRAHRVLLQKYRNRVRRDSMRYWAAAASRSVLLRLNETFVRKKRSRSQLRGRLTEWRAYRKAAAHYRASLVRATVAHWIYLVRDLASIRVKMADIRVILETNFKRRCLISWRNYIRLSQVYRVKYRRRQRLQKAAIRMGDSVATRNNFRLKQSALQSWKFTCSRTSYVRAFTARVMRSLTQRSLLLWRMNVRLVRDWQSTMHRAEQHFTLRLQSVCLQALSSNARNEVQTYEANLYRAGAFAQRRLLRAAVQSWLLHHEHALRRYRRMLQVVQNLSRAFDVASLRSAWLVWVEHLRDHTLALAKAGRAARHYRQRLLEYAMSSWNLYMVGLLSEQEMSTNTPVDGYIHRFMAENDGIFEVASGDTFSEKVEEFFLSPEKLARDTLVVQRCALMVGTMDEADENLMNDYFAPVESPVESPSVGKALKHTPKR